VRVEAVADDDLAHVDFVPANDNEAVITLDGRRSFGTSGAFSRSFRTAPENAVRDIAVGQ
jgi:hypothetical protein